MSKDFLLGVVFPYINLALFLFLALKFMRTPMREFAKARSKKFKEENHATGLDLRNAESELSQLEKTLAGLDSELAERQKRSLEAARCQVEELAKDTKKFIDQLKQDHELLIEHSFEEAKASLRHDLIAGVKVQVENELAQVLSPDVQVKLLRANITSLAQSSLKKSGEAAHG